MFKRIIVIIFIFIYSLPITYIYAGNLQDVVGLSLEKKSVLVEGELYKIGVKKTGVYKLTGKNLIDIGVQLSSLNLKHIAIYANQPGMLPENNSIYWDSDLKEQAIWIKDNNGNGYFDENDYILFYAESPNVWRYSSEKIKFDYQIHHYSFYNYYYLSLNSNNDGRRIVTKIPEENLVPTNETGIFLDYFAHEKEIYNPLSSGRQWLGEKISKGKNEQFSFLMPDKVRDSVWRCKIVLAGANDDKSTFSIKVDDKITFSLDINPVKNKEYKYLLDSIEVDLDLEKDLTQINVANSSSKKNTDGWMKKIILTGWRNLIFRGGQMNFRNPNIVGDGNITRFCVQKESNSAQIWDVSDPFNIYEILPDNEGRNLCFNTETSILKEFVIFDNSGFLEPDYIKKINNQNLHGLPLTEYVIVTHPNFREEAERLAEIHRKYSKLHVTVASTEEVYNEFSSGKQDPIAIRRFAKMFYDRVSSASSSDDIVKLKYLLLFGDGTYDNKNIGKHDKYHVITPQTYESAHGNNSLVEDQFFGFLEEKDGMTKTNLTLGVGRIPVNNLKEAKNSVDKIENYILKNDLKENVSGTWKTYIGIITDDSDVLSDSRFVRNAEHLAAKLSEDFPEYNIDKIYADAYKQQSGPNGFYYPDANNAIDRRMNSGALVMNYIGHGTYRNLGVEYFISNTDIIGYTNKHTLPLFVASTCDFGMFDRMSDRCGAEEFFLNPNGGAIAVIAPARKIASYENFNTYLISLTLSVEDGEQISIGDALKKAKNRYPNSDIAPINLLGDPALKLNIPENKVLITKINSEELSESTILNDTIGALSQVEIEGIIVNKEGEKLSDFDGNLSIILFDKQDTAQTLANDTPGSEEPFIQRKNKIYQGVAKINAGEFKLFFIAPLCIKYNFGKGKISLYAKGENKDAIGHYNEIIVGGLGDNFLTGNETRPVIKLFMNDTMFRSGGMTDENPNLIAYLYDDYGINFSGSCIGKDIEAWIDDNVQEIYNLNDYYEQGLNGISGGVVNYPFKNILPGKHSLTLRASNIFNLTEKTKIDFVVNGADEFEAGRLYNFPNPFSEKTTFVCEVNNKEKIKSAEIYICDIKGQLLNILYPTVNDETYSVSYVWDGRLNKGDKISNGIYIYICVIVTESGRKIILNNKMIIFSK